MIPNYASMFNQLIFNLILLYMIVFIIVIGGFILFGYVGYKIAIGLFELIFPKRKDKGINFIDNSVHYHIHEHKNLTIIDDDTKENILNNLN